jgi:hypothetical protein
LTALSIQKPSTQGVCHRRSNYVSLS